MSHTEMMNAVEKLGPKNAVFIIDACHAGSFKPSSNKMYVAVLAAKPSDEIVVNNQEESFTQLFIQHCKNMIKEHRRVTLFAIADKMEVTFSGHQWNSKLSIGPMDFRG